MRNFGWPRMKWEMGYYSHCDPCYTVFHKETESFTEVWTAYDASPAVFLARYREDMARYRNAPELSKPPAGKNLFNVSCIPWSSFYRLQSEFAERI